MSEGDHPGINDDAPYDVAHDEMMSALFAHMVMQNTNMALMFMGQVPHPQSGERVRDFEAAKMFIDQLEMLEVKTKGNLSPEEEKLLQQSLMHLRMTFVQAVEKPPPDPVKMPEAAAAKSPEPPKTEATKPEAAAPADAAKEEPHKRFSKKF